MIPTDIAYVRWDLHSAENVIAGALHRVGVDTQAMEPEDPEYGIIFNPQMQELIKQAADNLAAELRDRIRHKAAPLSFDGAQQVIEAVRGLQPRSKIKRLEDISYRIIWSGVKSMADIPKTSASVFIKAEGYPSGIKPPRLIVNPQEGEKLIMMMAFWHIMHPMFSSKYCTKEIPEGLRPRIITQRLGQGRFFVADYTSWECVPNRLIMQLGEHRVLRQLVPPEYHFLFDWIEQGGTLSSRQGVKIKTPAVQYSGRYTTSLCNTIRNKLLMDAVAMYLGVEYRGVFEGDDSLTRWPLDVSKEQIVHALGLIGVKAEINEVSELGEAGYCSMYWDSNLDVVIEPSKVCATFPFTQSVLAANPINVKPLLAAKAMSLIYRAPGCPVTSALGKKFISAIGIAETRNDYERRWFRQFSTEVEQRRGQASRRKVLAVAFNRWDLVREPTIEQRILFQKLFGIDIRHQELIEEQIMTYGAITPVVSELLKPSAARVGSDIEELRMIFSTMRERALQLGVKTQIHSWSF